MGGMSLLSCAAPLPLPAVRPAPTSRRLPELSHSRRVVVETDGISGHGCGIVGNAACPNFTTSEGLDLGRASSDTFRGFSFGKMISQAFLRLQSLLLLCTLPG